jgi:hypothetical protein
MEVYVLSIEADHDCGSPSAVFSTSEAACAERDRLNALLRGYTSRWWVGRFIVDEPSDNPFDLNRVVK